MVFLRKRRDSSLIDAIEAIEPSEFSGTAWRTVRSGRDPLQCSSSGGRWDDGTFDVLYMSKLADGAISEIRYHLSKGQPVFPTLVEYKLFEIQVSMNSALKLLDMDALNNLGLDTKKYGRLSYSDRQAEYPRTQDIGEVAHFLDFDGLIVPSARYDCSNVVLFCDRVTPDAISVSRECGLIDWNSKSIQ